MKLFKDVTIKQKLQSFEIPDFDKKIAIVKKWHDDYYHGTLKSDKETSRAPGYNQDFFFDILGYTRKPAERATFDAEYNLSGKRPDGVLGFFHTDENISDNVCAVVELKGAGIPVDQPQKREKNYTPIEQGFGYKRLLRNCPFVVVSNFYELRLYNDNEIDYELWTLDDLMDEKDDYYNFKKFYYLLCEQNLIAETGTSQTESLLSEIRLEEQEITKRFYKDYKERRLQLFRNLYLKNEILKNNPDLLIEKGQKLIDRIIFMCFAEGRGLLPADILQKIKKEFEKSQMTATMWDALKQAFNYVDKGNERWNLPDGYNGGLFARDDVLDDLKVEGHVLSKVIDFGMYNFANELSVTILGHIFEQSISDLEEIKTKIQEKGFNEDEKNESAKKVSKRKKDGIFYTPEYIVDYIIKNSLGAYLREHEMKCIDAENLHDELSESVYKKREIIAYTKYQEFLKQVKVLDPACGSGAFLVRVFDYLLAEHRRVGKILGGFFNTDEMYKSILQNNIYGVDLNQKSVEITKLSLWLKSAQAGKKLSNLDNNIKCGNSLIDDPEIAGDKAFKWEEEFSFLKCSSCHSGLDPESGCHCEPAKQSQSCNSKTPCSPESLCNSNASCHSLEKGNPASSCHCDEQSNLGFDVIVGNPPYGAKLPKEAQVFLNKKYIQGASETAISFIKLSENLLKSKGYLSFIIPKSFSFSSNYKSIREYLLDDISEIVDCKKVWKEVKLEQVIFVLNKNNKTDFYTSSTLNGKIINEIGNINKETFETFGFYINGVSEQELEIGQKIYSTGLFLNDISKNSRGGIFQKYISENGDTDVLGGAEIQRYGITGIKGKINRDIVQDNEKVFLKNNSVLVQRIVAHLANPTEHIKITACLPERDNFVIVDTINQITVIEQHSATAVWALLNSKLINWYVYRFIFAKAVRTMQFDNPTTSRIPIPEISKEENFMLVAKSDILLGLHGMFEKLKSRFIKRMTDNYELEKANRKLEKFYELDFGDFTKEMRKKSAKVGLSSQDELEEYFDKNKSELLELDTQIKKTDTEIDQMVYKLYGLNDEEIKIIENS